MSEIERAQARTIYGIGGESFGRIRATQPCDCGAGAGQFHVPDCDSEECPKCHRQATFCGCAMLLLPPDHPLSSESFCG
jgi:hypothetical protein